MIIEGVYDGFIAKGIVLEGFELYENEKIRIETEINTTNGPKKIVVDAVEDAFPDEKDGDLIVLTSIDDVHCTFTHDFKFDHALPGSYEMSISLVTDTGSILLLSPACENRLILHEGSDNFA